VTISSLTSFGSNMNYFIRFLVFYHIPFYSLASSTTLNTCRTNKTSITVSYMCKKLCMKKIIKWTRWRKSTFFVLLPLSKTAGVEFAELGSHISVAFLFWPSWISFLTELIIGTKTGTSLWSGKFSSKFPANSASGEPKKLSQENGIIKFCISMLSISKKGNLRLCKSAVNSAMWILRTKFLKGFNWYLDNVPDTVIYNVRLQLH